MSVFVHIIVVRLVTFTILMRSLLASERVSIYREVNKRTATVSEFIWCEWVVKTDYVSRLAYCQPRT